MPGSSERKPGLPSNQDTRPTFEGISREESRREKIDYLEDEVDPSLINVLPQGRKTFNDIEALSESIAGIGLIKRPVVARLYRERAIAYLERINSIHGTKRGIEGLVSAEKDGDEKFYILIAGERRYRAMGLLQERPCQDHRESGFEKACFSDHFPDGIHVNIAENISPIMAMFVQASENTHESISPHEEAYYYDQLFRSIKQDYPKYTRKQFAKDVGRGVEAMKNAERYCMVDQGMQERVEKGIITYGEAVQIARLVEAGVGDKIVDYFKAKLLGGLLRSDDLKSEISKYLSGLQNDNYELFVLEDQEGLRKRELKKRLNRATNSSFVQLVGLLEIFESGIADNELSPFTDQETLTRLRVLVNLQRKVLTHLQLLQSEDEIRENHELLDEIEENTTLFIDQLPSRKQFGD